jgi:hypothetical protein
MSRRSKPQQPPARSCRGVSPEASGVAPPAARASIPLIQAGICASKARGVEPRILYIFASSRMMQNKRLDFGVATP